MMCDEFEQIRERYRPRPTCLVFVGESRPAGGTFFYHGNSRLFARTREVFEAYYGAVADEEAFLRRFKSLGCFLVDLCREPVNELPKRERLKRHQANEERLATELEKMKPTAIVGVMKGMRESIQRVIANTAYSGPVFILPFPSHGHDQEFRSQLEHVIRTLVRSKVLAGRRER